MKEDNRKNTDKENAVVIESTAEVFPHLSLLKTALSLGACELKNCIECPRPKSLTEALREEFHFAIRPIFLKYLSLLEKDFISRTFSPIEQEVIRKGKTPRGWSIHHQKPLKLGGSSFNTALKEEIEKTSLTKEQERIVMLSKHPELKKLHFQLDNYLKKAAQKNNLEKAFGELFFPYLILLPAQMHRKIEETIIAKQIAFYRAKRRLVVKEKGDIPTRQQFTYATWPSFIYGGTNFTQNPTKVKHYQDKKKLRKRLLEREYD